MGVNALHILRLNIRKARLWKGLSQEAAAECAGLAAQHYQDIEAGRRPDLMLSTIERISQALEVDIWQLFKEDSIPDSPRKRGRSGPRIER